MPLSGLEITNTGQWASLPDGGIVRHQTHVLLVANLQSKARVIIAVIASYVPTKNSDGACPFIHFMAFLRPESG